MLPQNQSRLHQVHLRRILTLSRIVILYYLNSTLLFLKKNLISILFLKLRMIFSNSFLKARLIIKTVH